MENEVRWLLQEKYPEINPSDLNGASNGKLTAAAKKDIERLKAGEPLDHIIGFVEFLDCKILVDKNVLIPRFETEFWVEQAISNFKFQISNLRVLDMFAGSGCIGLAVLKNIRNTHVTFAESEKEALQQIEKNCQLNKMSPKRYEIVQSDVFSAINGKFNYIFANPPYIPQKNHRKVQKSVIEHEPHAALFGGEDGMLFIEKFLTDAKKFLNPGGKIFMEFDSPQKPAIAALAKSHGYKTCDFHKDQYGKWRFVVVQ